MLGKIGDLKRSSLGYLIIDRQTSSEYSLLINDVFQVVKDFPDVSDALRELPPKINSNHLLFVTSSVILYVIGLPLLYLWLTADWKPSGLGLFAFISSGIFWFIFFILVEGKKSKQKKISGNLFLLREVLRRNKI